MIYWSEIKISDIFYIKKKDEQVFEYINKRILWLNWIHRCNQHHQNEHIYTQIQVHINVCINYEHTMELLERVNLVNSINIIKIIHHNYI